MKKILIHLCCVTLLIALSLSLYACNQENDSQADDEQYQKGYNQGIEDTFLGLYNSIGLENEQILFYGDVWDTEDFSLTLCDKIDEKDAYINYNLTLKNTTVEHCFDQNTFFFYIYALSDTEGMLLMGEDFIYDGLLNDEVSTEEYLAGNNVKGKCKLLDNSEIQTLIIIISTKGHLYSAIYYT